MWYYVVGAVAVKVVYGRVRKAWIQYRSLKELRVYGESVGISYVPGEDIEKYRGRLIDARNKSAGK